MGKDRTILHIDMNNFYASVECSLNPDLRPFPVAVCGSVDERHGIVLAKNYKAKACGVKTGEAVWEAKQKCKDLVIVSPHYDEYMKYSKYARQIYSRYTDLIEPFGMDEVWADMTGSVTLLGDGEKIANEIRDTIKNELGLTVSVGVSFNKIFAKLGSDMKKPDATTVISKENFREKIFGLPASDLLGVGRATEKKLSMIGIHTIGDLAKFPEDLLHTKFGKCGTMLWIFANGLDATPVTVRNFEALDKSAGHGMTALQDLEDNAEVWKFILELSQEIGHRLYIYNKKAMGVTIYVRDNTLFTEQWQMPFTTPTQSASVIAKAAYLLFEKKYQWRKPIRSLTVRAIELVSADTPIQLSFTDDSESIYKKECMDRAIDDIRRRFGNHALRNAVLLDNPKYPGHDNPKIIMPNGLAM